MTAILVMAPVRGISDCIYRNAYAHLFEGVDEAVAPFLNALRSNKVNPTQLRELSPQKNALAVTPQIIGKTPSHFIALAKKLTDMGHMVINWNLGCPFPTMTKKGCGAALLPHPDAIGAFLDEVCPAVEAKISVKVRLGLTDKSELAALIPLFNTYPLAEIIVHPRTGSQMYKGGVDLEAVGQVLELSQHPVVYNGDITTLSDFQDVARRFPGVQKFMLGRGLFANPLLASEIVTGEEVPLLRRYERIFALHDVLLERYSERLSGPAHLYHRMSGHWEYLHTSLPKGKKFFKRLKRLKNFGDYASLVAQFRQSVERL